MDHRARLQNLLRELFQFDSADLDFGIYRILHQRRAEIESFIQSGLLDAVKKEFDVLEASALAEKQAELSRVAEEVKTAYGPSAIDEMGNLVIPEQFQQAELPLRYAQKREGVEKASIPAEAEAEIFNALYTFFSRYYSDGDFVTKRRYSRTEKYAIPYNGEEIYFHWANRDQYYVKTADTLTDYAFIIESHGGYRVRFKLADADVEQNNVKGEKRYFLPGKKNVAEYDNQKRDLTFYFEYRPLTEEEKEEYGKNGVQAKIIEAARADLLKAVPDTTLRALLAAAPTADESPLLDRHLTRWTRKSTSDYFIHKDLKGFLTRELDFYLKNEVLRLDDLDPTNAARAADYLTRMAVIREIGRAIIAFLAQVEDFQKRLFERPKFVLASEWCVTLDRLPKSLYTAAIANKTQWEEWERLFGVKKPKGNGKKIDIFISEHPSLTVDTALYDADFKDALLAALSERDGGLGGQTDGLLIHSENLQALTLLQEAYRGRVKCIYIDPPYNTGNGDFIYKDSYRHSSWIAMMASRLEKASPLLDNAGSLWITLDDEEATHCRLLGEIVFGKDNFVNVVAWQKVYSPRMDAKQFSSSFDSVLVFSKTPGWIPKRLVIDPDLEQFSHVDENGRRYRSDPLRKWGKNSLRKDRPNLWYPIKSPAGVKVWPIKPDGTESCWRWGEDTVKERYHELDWLDKGNGLQPYLRQYADESTLRPPETIWTYEEAGSTHESQEELKSLFPGLKFPTPKPTRLIQHTSAIATEAGDTLLDFFAGSGTTGHAVINLNRDGGGNRRYILVEQGEYFHTVLRPRIQKAIYAADWKGGQPVADSPGSSHAFQYLRLESYEDTLDNLDLRPELAPPPGLFPPETDDYLLKYMLDHETRELRLNVRAFETPFDYELRVRRDGMETRVKVDLLETANFLLVPCQGSYYQ